ncbi:hypothetical protein [Methylobacterium sp. sgz302541]|uniref:hypothetical protein n=1 Tax=unclassified Methylobacterium TaxID=2615210 RepID=UPI003D351460
MRLATAVLACATLLALPAAVMPTAVLANADDDAWIRRCISDNSGEGQSPETLGVYCSCMNGKMSSQETLSISAWEKKHPEEQEACSKKAKWRS